MNYYYYGFVFVGVLVKWLGIVPAVAYNLILPTIFSLVAMGAFTVGFNLFKWMSDQRKPKDDEPEVAPPPAEILPSEPLTVNEAEGAHLEPAVDGNEAQPSAGEAVSSAPADAISHPPATTSHSPFAIRQISFAVWMGLAAAVAVLVLGNMGTVKMLLEGWARLGGGDKYDNTADLVTQLNWIQGGISKVAAGAQQPYGIGDWYWNSQPHSRSKDRRSNYGIPDLYFPLRRPARPPVRIAGHAAGAGLGALRGSGRGNWPDWWSVGLSLFLGALAIGALRPANTWDIFTYLPLGVVALVYALGRYFPAAKPGKRPRSGAGCWPGCRPSASA